MRVLEKAGYTKESILKNAVVRNGKVLDEYVYEIVTKSYNLLIRTTQLSVITQKIYSKRSQGSKYTKPVLETKTCLDMLKSVLKVLKSVVLMIYR